MWIFLWGMGEGVHPGTHASSVQVEVMRHMAGASASSCYMASVRLVM